MANYYLPPEPGDIVQCRFPQDKVREPGPENRPGLVTDVEIYELEDGSTAVIVVVAYGTSAGVDERFPGEFKVAATDPHAGLAVDTKFDIGNRVKLRFDNEWFVPSPGMTFGDHPKRGRLNLQNLDHKRRLSSAITEAKQAGRDKVENIAQPPPGKKSGP